jgi:hypothetical protein
MLGNKTTRQKNEFRKREQARLTYIRQIIRLDSIKKPNRKEHHRNYRVFLIQKVNTIDKMLGYKNSLENREY